jgi:hypothetical protein
MAQAQPVFKYQLGKDAAIDVTVFRDDAKTQIRDVAGYTINFMIKRSLDDADGAALFSTTATVTGTYNIDPAANTQKVVAQIADTDLPVSTTAGGRVFWAFTRTDDGSETVLVDGTMMLKKPVKH